ncbi:MAG: hypothetical protein MJE63_14770 [Proteobacteria bacterium]|nr:hypothetical protein [Pseudomonadota bacterium]
MAKTKKRERFFVWTENYERFKKLADAKGVSVSALLREKIAEFKAPENIPKKARNLTIDSESNEKLQEIADEWFRSNTHVSGNRTDAVNYIIMKTIEKEF